MKDRCVGISELLERYFDGELSSRKAARVEAHLRDCSLCRIRLAELEKMKALVRTSLEESTSDEVQGLWERVAPRLPHPAKEPARPLWQWVFSLKPALAMALIIVAVAGFFTITRMGLEPGLSPNEVNILSLENSGPGVMVFQSLEADLTVIWILS